MLAILRCCFGSVMRLAVAVMTWMQVYLNTLTK